MSTFIEIPIQGIGTTLSFPVPFTVIDVTDIHVFIDDVELVVGTGFSVAADNGSVTLTNTPVGTTLLIKRITPSDSKLVDFESGAVLTEADLDLAFDQVFNITQEVLDVAVKDFKAATEAFNKIGAFLPEINTIGDDLGAGGLTHINFGDLTTTDDQPHSDSIIHNVYLKLGNIGTVATDLTKTTGTGSAITTVAGALTDVETVAAIKTAVETVSLRETQVREVAAIDTKVTDLAAIDSQIVAVHGNLPAILAATPAAATAEMKAAEAIISASNASVSAVTALGHVADASAQVVLATAQTALATDQVALTTTAGAAQVTLATGQVTLAAGQVALATTQAGISSTAADAALAALDSFDDRYLGQKAINPTVDNDGNTLVSGSLYFNTQAGVMNVYDGAVWVAAYASLSGAMMGVNSLSDVASASAARTNLGLVIGTDVHPYDGTLQGTLSSLQSQIDDNEVLILAGI